MKQTPAHGSCIAFLAAASLPIAIEMFSWIVTSDIVVQTYSENRYSIIELLESHVHETDEDSNMLYFMPLRAVKTRILPVLNKVGAALIQRGDKGLQFFEI